MAQQLRAHNPLAEELSLVPSTLVRQITPDRNTNFKGPNALCGHYLNVHSDSDTQLKTYLASYSNTTLVPAFGWQKQEDL